MTSLAPGGVPLTGTGTVKPSSETNDEEISPLVLQFMQQQNEELKKREWASWANKEYIKCKNARQAFDRQWYINIAFYMGKQYVAPQEVPGYGFRLSSPKAPPWRVRLVVNKVRTAIRTECAKLTSSKPIPTVLPSTNENEDLTAAKVAELLLKAHFRTADFEKTYRSWVFWGSVCGTSFLKSYWDGSAEDYDSMSLPEPPVGPNGQPIPPALIAQDPRLQKAMQTPVPAKGKIRTERVNPFHIYVPDLLAEDINQQPYLIHTSTRHPLWVEKAFGFKPTPDARAASTIMESATIIAKNSEQVLDAVQVMEVWLKPNAHPDFPEGGLLTIVNDQVRQVSETWPWPFREYPFYKFDGIPTGGFYGDSVIVDLIPVQKEYNRTRSQIIEIKNTMGKPRLLYQQGSINPRKISSEPGQAIPYIAGYDKPDILPAAEIPSTMPAEIEQLTAEFDDISGQHEITRGSTPSQVTSGTAIAFLQEQDDTKLAYQVASIENAIEVLGSHYLKYVATYWDEPRIIKVTGRDNAYESMKWKGSDLKGNTDVKVSTGSALPYSKAAKQALITEMMTNGFMDPMMGMELMEMPMLSKALDELQLDKRQAQRENMKMADAPVELLGMLLNPAPGPNGEQPMQVGDPVSGKTHVLNGDGTPFQPKSSVPVNSYDNHDAHIQYHNDYRKTQEFELLDPLQKQDFELHVQMHQMALMSQMVNMQGHTIKEGPAPVGNMPPEGMQGEPTEDSGQSPPAESSPQ